MSVSETRTESLLWWNNLTKQERIEYWLDYKQNYFSPSFNSNELTGREIEIIYSQLKTKP